MATHLEPRVAGVEIELLLVPRPVWDVRFAVDVREHRPVGINHAQRVVVCVVGPLKERDGKDNVQLPRCKVSRGNIIGRILRGVLDEYHPKT
jgi:hypothetical protein